MKCLFEMLNDHPSLTAFNFIDAKIKMSYLDVQLEARRLFTFIKKQGIKKGDYVLVSFEREHDLFISFLALSSVGAVMVPVSPKISSFELGQIAKIINIKSSLSDYSFIFDHQDFFQSLKTLDSLLTLKEGDKELSHDLFFLHNTLSITEKIDKLSAPSEGQVVSCHFTYKGFGTPLGVEHTYGDYLNSIESCQDFFNFSAGRKLLVLLPSYPVFGLVTNLLFPLSRGCELFIPTKRNHSILQMIDEHQIQHLNVVPVLLDKMLLESTKIKSQINLSALTVVAGGSHLSSQLYNQVFERFQLKVTQGYGLTETLPILTNHPNDPKPGVLGKIMRKGVELKILDSKGYDVPHGKAGEICLRGQGIIQRYLGDKDIREQLFRGGWLRTGDLAYKDKDNEIIFIGRRLNFTKILGNMVDLKEIEDLCHSFNGVKMARAFVQPDKDRERLTLSLFVTKDFSHTKKEITDDLRRHLSTFKIPSQIKIYKTTFEEVT